MTKFFHIARSFCVLCFFALSLTNPTSAQSTEAARTALVIGNSAYTKPDAALKNAANDARLMAQTLRGLGFEVMLREDLDRSATRQVFESFVDTVKRRKGIAFFYFAGHGVQVSGRNYIVPIGAHLVRDTDARDRALDIDLMLQQVRDTGTQLNLFVLDACRNNPLIATGRGSGNDSAGVGLAAMRPPAGSLVAFAAEAGRVASDGQDTNHGLYTRHLAKWLKEPLPIESVFKRTRESVKTESQNTQIPTEYSMLTGGDLILTKGVTQSSENSRPNLLSVPNGQRGVTPTESLPIETASKQYDSANEALQTGDLRAVQRYVRDGQSLPSANTANDFVLASGFSYKRPDRFDLISLYLNQGDFDINERGVPVVLTGYNVPKNAAEKLRTWWELKSSENQFFIGQCELTLLQVAAIVNDKAGYVWLIKKGAKPQTKGFCNTLGIPQRRLEFATDELMVTLNFKPD
jgi:Caspase domain